MKRYERTRVLIEGDPALAHEIMRDIEGECVRAAFGDEGDARLSISILDEPREELVMVQARETAKGGLFCFGEALMTSCRVAFAGAVGYGFVLGSDRCRAYELAAIDAAFTGAGATRRTERWQTRLEREWQVVQAREAQEASRVAATKVDFSTMAEEEQACPVSDHVGERGRSAYSSIDE